MSRLPLSPWEDYAGLVQSTSDTNGFIYECTAISTELSALSTSVDRSYLIIIFKILLVRNTLKLSHTSVNMLHASLLYRR
jgi:hypothetical protein